MGPYCTFCDRRCFTHLPHGTPARFLDAYRAKGWELGAFIIATCPGGQRFEKGLVGFSLDDILDAIKQEGKPR